MPEVLTPIAPKIRKIPDQEERSQRLDREILLEKFKMILEEIGDPHDRELMFLSELDQEGTELLKQYLMFKEKFDMDGMETVNRNEVSSLTQKVEKYNKNQQTEFSAALFNRVFSDLDIPVRLKKAA